MALPGTPILPIDHQPFEGMTAISGPRRGRRTDHPLAAAGLARHAVESTGRRAEREASVRARGRTLSFVFSESIHHEAP